MNQRDFIIKMMPMVIRFDKRLQVHTFSEVDGVWQHVCKRCAMCQAYKIAKEKLSTE